MRFIALIVSAILLLVPLAGCTGPDAEVTVDITSEELQQLIDDNQEDFLNNTTIVVFEEYHNNTTVVNNNNVVNNYNNSTDIDQSGASSSSSSTNTTNIYNGSNGEDIRMFTVQWNPADNVDDPTDNQLIRPFYAYCTWEGDCVEWNYGDINYDDGDDDGDGVPNYQDNDTDGDGTPNDQDEDYNGSTDNVDSYHESTIFVLGYNNQIVEITATCSEFAQYYGMNDDDWRGYLAENYGYDGNEINDAANNLESRFQAPWDYHSYQELCEQGYTEPIILFEIQLEQGTALEFLDHPGLIIDINCEDGFGTGIGNGVSSSLVGGQSNCTVSGSTVISWDSDVLWNYENGSNGDAFLSWNFEVRYNTPESFAVYFELRSVTVYQ